MSTCAARKGFLTLTACENPAVRACSQCGQSMCAAHLTPQSGFSTCFDCAASSLSVADGEYGDVWAHRYRSRYYSSTGYTPMAWSSRDDDYDQQDARSFDERERDAAEDEAERGGFGDS
jgi:hypothetical protein